jgi:MFS transporter, putative metabolite:H+ symporter
MQVAEYVDQSIDEMPLNSFHVRILTLIIAGLFFDLFDVAVLGSLIPDLIASKFAAPSQVAVVASATFAGLLIGSVAQGELTDRFGRKVVYQANLLLYGVATLAAAAAPDYGWLAVARFVAGLGLGAEIPLAYAYAAEFSPRASRGRVMACLNLFGGNLPFPLAILFTLLFQGLIGWRGIFVVIGVCALIVFLFRISLPESPRWLASHGRDDEAKKTLSTMGSAIPSDLTPSAARMEVQDPLMLVLVHYTRRAITLMVALFAAFVALYGLVTWLPTLMNAQGFNITKSLTFSLAITGAFPVSSILLIMYVDRIGRLRISWVSFLLAGAFALAFREATSDVMLLVCGFFMSLFVVTAANSLEIASGEIFPTAARSSGCGLGFGAGRAGAVLAAQFTPTILAVWGVGGVYVAIAIVLAIGAGATLMLGLEPAGKSLREISTPSG